MSAFLLIHYYRFVNINCGGGTKSRNGIGNEEMETEMEMIGACAVRAVDSLGAGGQFSPVQRGSPARRELFDPVCEELPAVLCTCTARWLIPWMFQ